MADISAKDVAALRKVTGAGMMDCKKALDRDRRRPRSGGGLAAREGPRGAAKRAGRSADQGAVDVVLEGNVAALVELNCETDFVAKGDGLRATRRRARPARRRRGRRPTSRASRSRARPSARP